jgi:hypothetical protein
LWVDLYVRREDESEPVAREVWRKNGRKEIIKKSRKREKEKREDKKY